MGTRSSALSEDTNYGEVYQTGRKGLAAVIIVVTAIIEIPMLNAFIKTVLDDNDIAMIKPMISSLFMIMGLPLFALGLYAVINGGTVSLGQNSIRHWLRTPLVYMPIALMIFAAAAIAAR